MLEDKNTNILFIADKLYKNYPDFARRFMDVCKQAGIRAEVLSHTNDVWARDFMPVQIEPATFVKYKYNPDYLQESKKLRDSITDCSDLCKQYRLPTIDTRLVIDGGNVVPCGEYVVMTDKVFTENGCPKYDEELTSELQQLFGHEIIFIPWKKHYDDVYGHADGFIKYVGGKQVMMGNHRDSFPAEADIIRQRLEAKGFEVSELYFDVTHPVCTRNWAYINFVQVGDKIIVPTFGIEEDEQAMKQIQEYFPTCQIFSIGANEIAKKGGALHCITWNVMLDLPQDETHADNPKE